MSEQKPINDFCIRVATVNGSGSQTANQILVKAFFRMGLPVSGKNLFPSNIAGLPTWFDIRVSQLGFVSRKPLCDILVSLNPATLKEDLESLAPQGFCIVSPEQASLVSRSDVTVFPIPFRQLSDGVTDAVKLKRYSINLIFAGVLAELLGVPQAILEGLVREQFASRESVVDTNLKAIRAGREYVQSQNFKLPLAAREITGGNAEKLLIDGNTAAAIGALVGGCTFASWYPITPASSLVEAFERLCQTHRSDGNKQKQFAVIQAEDELAAFAMVLGAGWAGARAMTATSGPGLSLMAEGAGLSYYAEIPTVLWNIQRLGPSTGLPTRTSQGDLTSSLFLSHGDTRHVVLIPSTVEECYQYASLAFDLAERLQTLVIVLSDLDLGMNLYVTERFQFPDRPFDRGKILSAEDLNQIEQFKRYEDVDGDGIGARTLPGTEHPKAAFFARGTGHDEAANYSENPGVYRRNMLRLQKKMETAAALVPKPSVEVIEGVDLGLLIFGSTFQAVSEIRFELKKQNVEANYICLKALPFTNEVKEFINRHKAVYVIEQNRDGQMLSLLRSEYPEFQERLYSVRQFDGLPIEPERAIRSILAFESQRLGGGSNASFR